MSFRCSDKDEPEVFWQLIMNLKRRNEKRGAIGKACFDFMYLVSLMYLASLKSS